MNILNVDPGKLTPYHNNPRRNKQAVPAVVASIKEFGFQQPIVIDKDNVIVVGHTRWLAALQLKMKLVPVTVAENLNPAQVAAYRLADNRVGEISEWDEEALFKELASLTEAKFDLKGMGFTAAELNEYAAPEMKEDLRYLQDFNVMPKAKPRWILIAASESDCAVIMSAVKKLKLSEARMEYSGDPVPDVVYEGSKGG